MDDELPGVEFNGSITGVLVLVIFLATWNYRSVEDQRSTRGFELQVVSSCIAIVLQSQGER